MARIKGELWVEIYTLRLASSRISSIARAQEKERGGG
jgi:hypothetical protein